MCRLGEMTKKIPSQNQRKKKHTSPGVSRREYFLREYSLHHMYMYLLIEHFSYTQVSFHVKIYTNHRLFAVKNVT